MASFWSPRRSLAGVALCFVLPAVCVTCVLLARSTPAHAEDKTAARDHWERGTKFYDLGKYDDAIREFEAAYEAKGDPAFLFNLAQSHRLAGHANDALRFYRTYLRYVPKAPNRADIEEHIKELEKTVAERPATEPVVKTPPSNVTPPPAGGQVPPPLGGAPTNQLPPAPGSATGQGQSVPASPPYGGPGSMPAAGTPYDPQGVGAAPQGTPNFGAAPFEAAPTPQKSGRKTAGITLAAVGGGVVVVGAVFGLIARSQSKKVETADRFDPGAEK